MDKFNIKLETLLSEKVKIEKRIAQLVSQESPVRFSYKKFVANLGEYYFFKNCKYLFEKGSLIQSKTSNASVDFSGHLLDEFVLQFQTDKNVRIEVKTRYHQTGNPHIRGLDTSKFDLLAFVAIDEIYSFDYVGLLKASDIKPDSYKRIRFVDYNAKIIWSNKSFTPY